MPTMKTPGVFIVEKNAFPNSVVEVATAVPAFIGYTERAVNGSKPLLNKPWRISSMDEYLTYFGGPARPCFQVAEVSDPAATPPWALEPGAARGQLSSFSWNGRHYQLSRSAGRAGGRFLMHLAMRHFFQNGGGPCYIVSVGGHGDEVDADALIAGLDALLEEQEPTMVLTPDAVLLDEAGCTRVQQQVLAHCGRQMKNRVAILDIWGGDLARRDAAGDCIATFRAHLGLNYLGYAAAYYPWLHTSLVAKDDLDFSVFGDTAALTALAALLRADLGIDATTIAANAKLAQIGQLIDDMPTTDAALVDATPPGRAPMSPVELLHKSLVAVSPLYARLMVLACEQLNLMPPAAAMAGIYCMVDNTRGVWTAPANVSIASVVRPAVDISNEDQGDLNTSVDGKSVNAIRSFIGEGVLVWGARTLDGNSLDWRYINVRRTMIVLEQSCRLAAKAMVFEPNVNTTWVTIKSMIENYLTDVWKRGGLFGTGPADAFKVQVGLGETMTAEDILEGVLRVSVLVAISHPAEFIEMVFQQQMQKS